VYLGAASERAGQVAALTDQMFQSRVQEARDRLQRRQERFNLGLTGLIGAILMVLAAIQSLSYAVPLPQLVKPAVVAALGAFALLASLLVLRAAVPERAWSLGLVFVGVGLVAATATWVAVSALVGRAGTQTLTWQWAGAGFTAGVFAAALLSAAMRRRRAR
jgi:membrane associated rhomboid family serine protease